MDAFGDKPKPEDLKWHLKRLEQLSEEEEVMEAYLSMQEMKEVGTETARRKVWSRIDRKSTIHHFYIRFSRAAAILIFPLLLIAVWGLSRQRPVAKKEVVTQEISVPLGIRSRIILPDSSYVWLNSGSSIRYHTPFSENREVSLSGEAYFEVVHDPIHPFFVHAGNSRIEVLGTSFNVKAYQEEPDIEVALIEGKLRFTPAVSNGERREVILRPGDRAVFENDNGVSVIHEPLEKYAAWRLGRLVFDETPMREVARDLERWFGVKVILTDPKLSAYRFTTTFENQSLQQVLELLELSSPLKSRYEPAVVNKDNQPGQPAKVYFSFATSKNKRMTE
jgi:ferric-dicitrate binding protein FerR (iron transport regulator)